MKIGIFGDSFACTNSYLDEEVQEKGESSVRLSWMDHLNNHPDFQVNCHSAAGSNLFYSFKQFKKFQKSYDTIVIAVTNWPRIWLPQIRTVHPHVPGLSSVENLLEYCKDEDDTAILKAAKEYFIFLENEIQLKETHLLLLEEIKRIRPDVIFIPCFDSSQSMVLDWEGPTLSDISDIDISFYRYTFSGVDRRHCHFNDENNEIFSNRLREYILSDRTKQFEIDIHEYVRPTKPRNYYFF